MVDVVFLLLIFFLWTSSFRPAEDDLPGEIASDAPSSGSSTVSPAASDDGEPIVVRIELAEGRLRWLVNDRPHSELSRVAETLRAVAAINTELPVIVDPDDAVPLGHAMDVYDLSRRLGWQAVRLATRRPTAEAR